jgi:hypothetical protein
MIMPNKIIKNDNVVSVRIDDAYTTNEKHLILPYVRKDGKESFFGSFKFLNAKDAYTTLKDAVKQLGAEDTIFGGQYPKWETDNYGSHLSVNNRVKFYEGVGTSQEIPDLQIRDNIYSLELTLSKTKDNGIYLRVARAIKLREQESKYNDALYDTEDTPF